LCFTVTLYDTEQSGINPFTNSLKQPERQETQEVKQKKKKQQDLRGSSQFSSISKQFTNKQAGKSSM